MKWNFLFCLPFPEFFVGSLFLSWGLLRWLLSLIYHLSHGWNHDSFRSISHLSPIFFCCLGWKNFLVLQSSRWPLLLLLLLGLLCNSSWDYLPWCFPHEIKLNRSHLQIAYSVIYITIFCFELLFTVFYKEKKERKIQWGQCLAVCINMIWKTNVSLYIEAIICTWLFLEFEYHFDTFVGNIVNCKYYPLIYKS